MPYYVQKSGKTWELKFKKGKTESRHVPKTSQEARLAGFHPNMNLDEAKEQAKRDQARSWRELNAKRAAHLRAIVDTSKKLRCEWLSDLDVEAFETKLDGYKIRTSHWRTMQKVIVGVALHPKDWHDNQSQLLRQFIKQRCSYNYVRKLMRYLHFWGHFYCNRHGGSYLKFRVSVTWRQGLEEHRRGWGRQSKPLSAKLLDSKKAAMIEEHYNWLFLSVWFGLRPREVDNLTVPDADLWRVEQDSEGYVLHVFQEKLYERGTPKDDCWKAIPCVFQEQERGMQILLSGKLRRPVGEGGKFMSETFGQGYSHYAGRNNFSGMLREAGYDLEARKHWMGHLSVKTTEAYDRKTLRQRAFRPKKSA